MCLESLKRELAAYTEASLRSSLLDGASLLGAYTSVCVHCVSLYVCVRLCAYNFVYNFLRARSIKTELNSAKKTPKTEGDKNEKRNTKKLIKFFNI